MWASTRGASERDSAFSVVTAGHEPGPSERRSSEVELSRVRSLPSATPARPLRETELGAPRRIMLPLFDSAKRAPFRILETEERREQRQRKNAQSNRVG